MQIVSRPSLNYDSRPKTAPIDMLVIHYTDMETAEEALDLLCSPASKVSSHYLISENGHIYRLVEEENRAWHAGVSFWKGRTKLNDYSIGIELANPGHRCGYKDFPQKQIDALIQLSHGIMSRHHIPPYHVVAHSDIAPDRKKDPGEKFPWKILAQHNIGFWPSKKLEVMVPHTIEVFLVQQMLSRIGYHVPMHGMYDPGTKLVIEAFQRHFCPHKVHGIIDPETYRQLVRVADEIDGQE
jgi:N-acetylmuramoyl-L-alanine amidase